MIGSACYKWLIAPAVLSVALGGPLAAKPRARKSATRPAARPAARPPAHPNETKGQGQLAGANGQFGTIYTLKDGFNFEILAARYSLEPFLSGDPTKPDTDEKLLVLDVTIKNSTNQDNFFNSEHMFTFVDDKGQLKDSGNFALDSRGEQGYQSTLKPGQGLGQAGLKDPLRVAVSLPARARIVKIIVNRGRAGSAEDVLRYYVAGATKAEAGEAGDPKNGIAPLPGSVRDPADASGAIALDEGKGVTGVYVPSGFFDLRLDSFAYSTRPLQGNPPDDGKKFAIATVTAKGLTEAKHGIFDVKGGDAPLYEVTDADGERYKPQAFLKARQDEDADHEFAKGDEYTFRIVFLMPRDAPAKKLVLGAGGSRKWAYDVSAIK